MNNPLINRFELQIKSLKGFDFQDFIVELFLLQYGPTGFTVIRKKKDRGCDGIINCDRRVIACYGPESNDYRKFNKKVEDDYTDFKSNWQKDYPQWMFIINQDVSPKQEQKVKALANGALILGIKQIIAIIEELNNSQRRKIGKYLNIESEFLASDYLNPFLEDLLKGSQIAKDSISYNKNDRIDIEDKIKLNYNENDIADAFSEYGLLIESGALKEVSDLMYCYEDEEIDKLKHRVLYDFSNLTGGYFKERLKQLSEHYLSKYSVDKDDDYLHYIRAVLIHLFEQCLIGIKTQKEK